MRFIIFILIIFYISQVHSNDVGTVTGYKIPRFVVLKSDDVNLRVGPSINYPILVKYVIKNLPIEIIDEHESWRQVRDIQNNIGWIHKSLLKGDRYGIVNSNENKARIYNFPKGEYIGYIGNRNIVKIKTCIEKWCFINLDDKKGWINKNNLWGVYMLEIYKVRFYQPLLNFYWKLRLKFNY